MKSKVNKLIVISGPNASGKSNLGVSLAKQLGGEIISADSRQIYKNLNIGSGKITKKEMMGIPHHCLDIANPKKIFTAYDYKICAEKAIQKIWQKNKIPIIVGGTGFYIDAVTGRIKLSNIPPNPKLRKRLLTYSATKLFSMLKKLDPKKAKNIDKNNKVRLVRAIEILRGERLMFSKSFRSPKKLGLSRSESFWGENADNRPALDGTNYRLEKTQGVRPENILWIGIKRKPEKLKKLIHDRLLRRLRGIIKEIKYLRKNGLSWKRLFDLGLEYRYVSLYLRGMLNKKEMIKKLEAETNQYAKRQMTYFKRNKEIHWVSSKKEIKKLVPIFIGT